MPYTNGFLRWRHNYNDNKTERTEKKEYEYKEEEDAYYQYIMMTTTMIDDLNKIQKRGKLNRGIRGNNQDKDGKRKREGKEVTHSYGNPNI